MTHGSDLAASGEEEGGLLAGYRLLDLSTYFAGPYGCTLLADAGMDVIKIESPEGDTMRRYPTNLKGENRAFLGANRNKRSIMLNLKNERALAAFYKLVETADVVVDNFRPGVAERIGIGYEKLRAIRPDIIVCSLTGYGEHGPFRDRGGFDQVLQTMSGIAKVQTDADGNPNLVRGSAVDVYTSSLLAFGVTTALLHRQRTGKGRRIALSLLRTAIAMQPARFVWAEGEDRYIDRELRSGGFTGLHPTKEGTLYISAPTHPFWMALCGHLGMKELAEDPRYDTVKKRAAQASALIPIVRKALAKRTAREWEEVFGTTVPCAVLQDVGDMFDHPQVLAEDMVIELEHPTAGRYRTQSTAVSFGADGERKRHFTAPLLGEHSESILREIGIGGDEFQKMREEGATI